MLGAAGIHPCAAVGRRACVVVVPAVFDPDRDVTFDVVQPHTVRGEAADRRWSPEAVAVMRERLGPTALEMRRTVAVAGEICIYLRRVLVAPRESCRRAGTQGVFELRFTRQAILLAGAGRQPL